MFGVIVEHRRLNLKIHPFCESKDQLNRGAEAKKMGSGAIFPMAVIGPRVCVESEKRLDNVMPYGNDRCHWSDQRSGEPGVISSGGMGSLNSAFACAAQGQQSKRRNKNLRKYFNVSGIMITVKLNTVFKQEGLWPNFRVSQAMGL